jgi:prevent-host-death family protein
MDIQPHAPAKTINAGKARQNFGQLLEQVYYRSDQLIIERAGKPMAAVVPLSQLEEWQTQHGRPQKNTGTITEGKRRRKQKKV